MDIEPDRMTEAEVAIRLAEYLLSLPGCDGHADVAIDGAGVAVAGVAIFGIADFLSTAGWQQESQVGKNHWTGAYGRNGQTLRVHSRSGIGDVEVAFGNRRVVAECKKGPLIAKPGSPERPLLTTALGQALLIETRPGDVVVAAVPDTPQFGAIAKKWRTRPLLVQSGIGICLVGRDGSVSGLEPDRLNNAVVQRESLDGQS